MTARERGAETDTPPPAERIVARAITTAGVAVVVTIAETTTARHWKRA